MEQWSDEGEREIKQVIGKGGMEKMMTRGRGVRG